MSRFRSLFASVVVAMILGGCGGSGTPLSSGETVPTSEPLSQDQRFAHVHGLGIDPADNSVLYAATHFGLWRLSDGGDPELVGEHLHDFMGFVIVGPDHFLASGHPNGVDDIGPHLGLIESTDGGLTWQNLSLAGEADFHGLRPAGEVTYGWNSTNGALLASSDRRQWDERTTGMLVDFVPDPADSSILVASFGVSDTRVELRMSDDGGRTWTSAGDGLPQLIRLAWSPDTGLVGVEPDGRVFTSDDGGASWVAQGTVNGAPEALAAGNGELVVAAGEAIQRSDDGGESWTILHSYG